MTRRHHDYDEALVAIATGVPVQWLAKTGEWLSQPADWTLSEIAARFYPPNRYRVDPAFKEQE